MVRAVGSTEEERLEGLPLNVRKRVCLINRPIYEGRTKRARTAVRAYADNPTWAVRFEDMRVGDVVIVYCPESDSTHHFAWRMTLGHGTLSPWLFMVHVKSLDRATKQVTWMYTMPTGYTDRNSKSVAIQKAGQPKTWKSMAASTQTAPWDEDEVVLSWTRQCDEKGYCVPKEQYNQAKLVLLAVEQARNAETED